MPDPRRAHRRPPRNASAIAARVTTYFLLAWGTIATLAAGLFPGAFAATIAFAVYTMVPLLAFIRWRGWPFYPGRTFRLLVVRPFWYTQLLLPLVSAAGLLGLLAGAPFGRAILLGRIFSGVIFSAAAALLLLGYIGARRLTVRNVDVEVPGLGPEFDGLRIVQLSDLHVGPHTSLRFLQRIVDTTRSLTPDLIAVTGDLVDDRAEDVAAYVRSLGALEAPMGVFMIPGNHDVYAGWDAVEQALEAANLGTVLVNDVHLLTRGDSTLTLLGTGDPAGGSHGSSRVAPDVERAMGKVSDGAVVVAFAHNPALWPALAKHGVALTLSGHTHYGQFAFPKLGWSMASPFLEYAMGAHQADDALLYISPGTGYWGIPFRLGASPEITVVTLRRGASASAHVGAARVA
jgi:predicted MPP superfamily phosphohydrolase